jgi:DNA (cytosine-5)-methyltransferase 1
LNHIELFAGCGGLGLGLDLAGFELVLANELSPMAAETFAYNFYNEDLSLLASQNKEPNKKPTKRPKHVFWLSSQYEDLKSRLRENPFRYPLPGSGFSDMPSDPVLTKGGLIVANIIHLNDFLSSNAAYLNAYRNNFCDKPIDLVSGGPPCQSFSLAGLRKKDCEKNTLPWEFARFVEMIQPKFVLLENVSGILRAFKQDGVTYHAWFEVAKVFADKGYIPLCLHVNAKRVGVAQNRPRFIMLGIRHDLYHRLSQTFNEAEWVIFESPLGFYNKVSDAQEVSLQDLNYYDVEKQADRELYRNSFLSSLLEGTPVSCREAVNDLKFSKKEKPSYFVTQLNALFSARVGQTNKIENHQPRQNNLLVQRRFRIYQVIRDLDVKTANNVRNILKGSEQNLDEVDWQKLAAHDFLSIEENRKIRFNPDIS